MTTTDRTVNTHTNKHHATWSVQFFYVQATSRDHHAAAIAAVSFVDMQNLKIAKYVNKSVFGLAAL